MHFITFSNQRYIKLLNISECKIVTNNNVTDLQEFSQPTWGNTELSDLVV